MARQRRHTLNECFRCDEPSSKLELAWWTWRHVQLCPPCIALGRKEAAEEAARLARAEATTVVLVRRDQEETRPLERAKT